MKKILVYGLSAVFLLSGCASTSYVYEGGKRRKAKRWEVRQLQSKTPGGGSNRSCVDNW